MGRLFRRAGNRHHTRDTGVSQYPHRWAGCSDDSPRSPVLWNHRVSIPLPMGRLFRLSLWGWHGGDGLVSQYPHRWAGCSEQRTMDHGPWTTCTLRDRPPSSMVYRPSSFPQYPHRWAGYSDDALPKGVCEEASVSIPSPMGRLFRRLRRLSGPEAQGGLNTLTDGQAIPTTWSTSGPGPTLRLNTLTDGQAIPTRAIHAVVVNVQVSIPSPMGRLFRLWLCQGKEVSS